MRGWLLALITAGCGSFVHDLTLTRTYEIHLDPRYQDESQIREAFDTWRTESGGRIDLRVASGDGDGYLYWGFYPGTDDACRARRSTLEAWAAPEAFSEPRMLYRCVMLMVARIFDIETTEHGVLNRQLRVDKFTDEDRASCRDAGWCL